MTRRLLREGFRPRLSIGVGVAAASLLVLGTPLVNLDWYGLGGYDEEQVQVAPPPSCALNGTATNTSFDGAFFSIHWSNLGCGPGGALLAGFVRDPSGSSGFFNLSGRLANPQWFTPGGSAGITWSKGGSVLLLVRAILL